jgi:hypothetical protein
MATVIVSGKGTKRTGSVGTVVLVNGTQQCVQCVCDMRGRCCQSGLTTISGGTWNSGNTKRTAGACVPAWPSYFCSPR